MSNYKGFFKDAENIQIYDFEEDVSCTIEELYQAFRARMLDEIESDIKDRMAEFLGASNDEDE